MTNSITEIKLNEMVAKYQAGDTSIFTEIFKHFAAERGINFIYLRKSLPSAITQSDIIAMMDDSLLLAVENYCEGSASFRTYYRAILENNRLSAIRFALRKKRDCNIQLVTTIMNDFGTQEDILWNKEDLSASELMLQAEGSEILFLLQEYGKQSSKKSLNATLIAHETLYFISSKEKYNSIRNITGLTASDTALRLKCKRAKEDFRKFVEGTAV